MALALIAALSTPRIAGAQSSFVVSARVAEGSYLFSTRTVSTYLVAGVDTAIGPLRASVSVPFVYQTTPWVSYGIAVVPSGGPQQGTVSEQIRGMGGMGGGGTDTGNAGTGTGAGSRPGSAGTKSIVIVMPTESSVRQAGVGDPVIRVSYQPGSASASTSVRFTGAAKPGLADVTRGFGTGETDVGAGLAVTFVRDMRQLSASFEAWRIGDMPDLELRNAASYRVAYDQWIQADRWSAGSGVSGWTRIIDGVDPPLEISATVSRHFGAGRSLGVTTSFGLTQTSPDVTAAVEWRGVF